MHGAGMTVVMSQPAIGHAAAGGKAPLEVTGKDSPPPAEEVPVMGATEPVDEVVADENDSGEGDDDNEGEEGGEGEGNDDDDTEEEEEAEEGKKWLKHYSSMQSILLVGDADFSFSLVLATAFRSGANLVATSLNTYACKEDMKVKYSKAESNIAELKRLGTRILHGVDVNTMKIHTELKGRWFDQVIFNFPHAGFKGREDQVHLIKLHKNLVRSFFQNSIHMLRPYGEIHVSHETGHPCDSWNLECLAAEVSLVMFEKSCFQKEDYPGYNNNRGSGPRCDETFPLGSCCTLKSKSENLKKHKKPNQNRVGPVSLIGGHNSRAENFANNIRPAIGNVTRPHFLAPWYMQRTIAGPPGRDNYSYFDHQL